MPVLTGTELSLSSVATVTVTVMISDWSARVTHESA